MENYNTIICTSASEMKEVKRLLDERGFKYRGEANNNYNGHIERFKSNVFITFKDKWNCGSNEEYTGFTNQITFSEFMEKQTAPEKWWMKLKKGDEVQCSAIPGKRPDKGYGDGGAGWSSNKKFIVKSVVDYKSYGIIFNEIGKGVFTNSLIPIYSQKTKTNEKRSIKIYKQDSEIRRGQAKRGTPIQSGRPGKTIRGRYHGNVAGNHE